MSLDLSGKRVWVAGHRGMVGSAVARRLARENCEVITARRETVDLKHQIGVGTSQKESGGKTPLCMEREQQDWTQILDVGHLQVCWRVNCSEPFRRRPK